MIRIRVFERIKAVRAESRKKQGIFSIKNNEKWKSHRSRKKT